MNIQNTTDFFKNELKKATNKREIKVYKSFISILTSIENRGFTEDQLSIIEKEIRSLDLKSNPNNKRKFYSKKLTIFKQFLKDEFSLISEGYYTAIGISLGMCFGVALGTNFGITGNSLGLVIGMAIGLAIGRHKDKEAEEQNKVLKNNSIN